MTTKLSPTRIQPAGHYIFEWAAAVEAGTTIEDIQKPEFWAHRSSQMKPMHIIKVIPDDGSYFAELLVLSAGNGFAKVMLIRDVTLDTPSADVESTTGFKVKYNGPHDRYVVIRVSDGEKLRVGFTKSAEAELWARDHAAAMAA